MACQVATFNSACYTQSCTGEFFSGKIKKQDQKIIFEFNDVENLISLAPSKAESIFFEYDQERDIYIKSNTQKIGGLKHEE